jgi:hypothetical protein
MKLFFVLVGAAAALFFTTSHAAFGDWPSCHLRPVRCSLSSGPSDPPAAKDVDRVIAAAYRDHLDVTLLHLYLRVNQAHEARKGTSQWAFEVEHTLPGLAQRVGELTDAARLRVATVEVETLAGRRFRSMAVRGLRLQGLLYRALARELASKQPTLKAFDRWGIRVNALHRWFLAQSRSVVAAANYNDRAAVMAAVLRY